ncbi:hypothetical protein [Mucilaginibacter sp. HD30]
MSGWKELKLKGFKTISDTLLSIYNDTGFKSAVVVNNTGALTCELLIPIKLLGIAPNSGKMIFYNVMINGVTSIQRTSRPSVEGAPTVSAVPRGLGNATNINSVQYPTDFWGSYVIK